MKARGSLVTVLMEDGEEVHVKLGGSALVAIERRWRGRQIPPVESAYFGAWFALGKPGVGSEDDDRFDDWLSKCEAIEDAEAPEEVPTQPAP